MTDKEPTQIELAEREATAYRERYTKSMAVFSALSRFTNDVGIASFSYLDTDPDTVRSIIYLTTKLTEDVTYYLSSNDNLRLLSVSVPFGSHRHKEQRSVIEDKLIKKGGEMVEIPSKNLNKYYQEATYRETNIPGLYLQTLVPVQESGTDLSVRQSIVDEQYFR